jgi:hypothetical protein
MHGCDATDDVKMLLERCTELRSLCLEWPGRGAWSPEFLVRSLHVIGRQVVFLSLHHLDYLDSLSGERDCDGKKGGHRFDVLDTECLKEVCLACPNLEQFGYRISDGFLMTHYEDGFYAPMVRLRTV